MDRKIAIGTNFFGDYKRQTLCKECLLTLKDKYKNNLELYDIQFEDERETYKPIGGFNTLFELKRSARENIQGAKKLPYLNDILDILYKQECDVFLFTNSDILITEKLIKLLLFSNIDAATCSRMDILPIKTLNDPIKPYRIEIFGFDVFIFVKKWFEKYRNYFELDFLMGAPWFDQYYAGVIRKFSTTPLLNDYPSFIYHEHHTKNWSPNTIESKYNQELLEASEYHYIKKKFDEYLNYLKVKRRMGFNFYKDDEEVQKELEYVK